MSQIDYTRDITPKRVKSTGVHLRSLAPGQHSSEERRQQWRAVGDTVFNLSGPGIEPRPTAPLLMPLTITPTGMYTLPNLDPKLPVS